MPLGDVVINSQIRSRLSPAQFHLMFDELFAYGHEQHNDFVDMLEAKVQPYEEEACAISSRCLYTLLIPGNKEMQAEGPYDLDTIEADPEEQEKPRPFSRRIVKAKAIQHLRRKGMSRKDAVAKVNSLTDDQLDGAVGQLPVKGIGDWMGGIWDWIKANWPTILKVVLSLLGLLAFL